MGAKRVCTSTFQFTLPRGERRTAFPPFVWLMGFNSRSREGSDKERERVKTLINSFNSRSREGSDPGAKLFNFRCRVSIHAPARGATVIQVCTDITINRFNSRSREGSDQVRAI